MALAVAVYTLTVSVCYAVLAVLAPDAARVLTIPFVALVVAPCLYLNYQHVVRRNKDV